MAEPDRDQSEVKPEKPLQATRRGLIASVAALIAAGLTKASETPAEAQTPSLFFLNRKNISFQPTGLCLLPQVPGGTALEIEATGLSTGLQVTAGPFAGAFAVTGTATPGAVFVGQPAVIGGAAPGSRFPNAPLMQFALETAQHALATDVQINLGLGSSVLAVQGQFTDNEFLLSQAFAVTATAAMTGVTEMDIGVRGLVLNQHGGGAAGWFENPRGIAVIADGQLVARDASFDGDVDVRGRLTVNGLPVGSGGMLASGEAMAPAGVHSFDVVASGVNDDSLVLTALLDEPRPKPAGVSHIRPFEGGFRVFFTHRLAGPLRFKWAAFPC